MRKLYIPLLITALSLLPFFKKGVEPKPSPRQPPPQPDEDVEVYKRRAALYRRMLERYREVIEASEDKSVAELRSLINPENSAVQLLKGRLTEDFRPYIYERDFMQAAERAYAFVKDEIKNEPLPLDFWLTPEDMLELKVADEIDKAMLLCSLLIAFENHSAKVVVETGGRLRHAFVLFEFGGKTYKMDPAHGVFMSGTREEVLAEQLSGAEKKLVYEFNNSEYNEW